MKQKQFFFALVAMLSFVFSGFAQTIKVDTEKALKEALTSTTNSEIVLDNDIEQTSSIAIAKGVSHTLDLNGHKVKASATFKDFLLKTNGNLTIKDSRGGGELVGTIKTLYCVAGGKITINGGTITSVTGNPIYATGDIEVTKGNVLSNGTGVAITTSGAYANLALTGDVVVTSINFDSKGSLNITGANATVEKGLNVGANAKAVNISAGTIKGDVKINDAVKEKVTISGGSFPNADVSEYLEDGMVRLENGEVVAGMFKVEETGVYYPTLAAAAEAAQAGNEIVMLADATVEGTLALPAGIKLTSNGHTINGSISMLGNLELNGALTITGGLWVGKSGETLTATLSGDKLTAGYFMFQRGAYTINADIDAVYGYLSFEGTFEVNSTIHTTGANGEVLYINGNVTLNDGAVLDSDNSVFVNNDNAVLTLKPGSKVDSKVNITTSGAKLNIDATGMTAGASANITGTVTNSGNGTIAVVGNDKLEAKIVDGKIVLNSIVAKIGDANFASLQAAINAVKNGETIILIDNVAENVTLTEKVGLRYTIDGAGKTMNGKIAITPLSDENDNRRITIKGINFVNTADAAVDFISCAVTNHYPRLTVEGCTFTGNGKNTDVALRLKTAYGAVIKDCTGTGLHSFLQNTAGKNFTIENVKVTDSKSAFALGTVQGVTIKGCEATVEGYGIRLDANTYNNNAIIEDNAIKAFIPVVVRNANTESNITVKGTNTMNATNADGIWFAAGTSEYETNGQMPTATTGKVLLVVNDENLNIREAYGNYVEPVAKVGDKPFGYIEDAIAAWTNNTTLTLLADVTLSDVIQLSSTEMHTLDLGTFTMTAASKKDAIQIVNNGRSSASYALDIKADAENPGGITATGKAVVRTTGKSGVKDRPIIRFYNGVFTGTNVIYHSGSNGTNCPQFQFHGGVFNGTVYANRALIQFYGGTFNGSLQMSVDSSAYGLVAGGRFKQLSNLYMSALNKDKFTIGSAKGVYDREVYIDEEGYYVVAKTEPAEGIEADVAKKPGTNDYLAYSKVATEGQLGYTNVETALKNNTSATVTVYADEVDMSDINSFKGTIIVPVGETVKITNAPANLKVESADGYAITPNNNEYVSIALVAKIGEKIYDSFEKAVAEAQDGAEVTIHKAGTYNVPTGKNLTITGAVEGVQFGPIAEPNLGMKNYTFNNVTFNYANDSHYKGLQYAGKMEYNNCTFNGQVFLYGQKETFNKCTFNQTTNNYNVWTYGAKEVAFNECTFNSAGKSVLIYHEDATMFNNVAVTKSTFNASQAVEGKAAIEMDASLTAGINLTIDAATKATGFAAGNVSGNSLWNNKKGNADEANNDITVKVGDETVLAPVYEAKIGEKNYRNFQDAIDAVQNGETITVLRDIATNVEIKEKDNVKVTIDGNGMKMTGTIKVVALSSDNDRRITIKNFKFEDTTSASVDFITSVETNHYPRITVEGCTFTGSGDATDVALRLKSSKNVEIKNCTGKGLHSFLQNTSGWNLTIEGVTVTESKSAFALGTVQGVTVKGCEANVEGYGIRLDAQYNNNAVIESNKIEAFIPVVVRKAEVNSNVTIQGTNEMTATNTDGIWFAAGTTEYEENDKLPTAHASAKVFTLLNDENLSVEGMHGNALPVAKIGNVWYASVPDAIGAAETSATIELMDNIAATDIITINKPITLDGNGKKLTSTAGRAINVDTEGKVDIKNLTINASGERAINVIQKPANVTIENVTATAANYTVNLASSAGAAKVAISNSNLTGLNVVNVAAAGSNVTINGGTITCNDQNANENYAALAMNKDAVGAKIAATGVTFDIKGDSKKASNGAVDGEITIDGKTDEVAVNVAYISYGNNYYSFTSIEAAIEAANAGQTIGLIRNITASDIITINKAITLDGNGKKLTSTAGRAINVSGADGATIKNLTIECSGERAINVIQNATNVTIDGVTATAKNYTVNVAASAPNAVVAIKNSTLNGLCTVNVSAAGAKVTVDKSTVNCNDNNTTAGESYAALSLNKEAVGGSIVATNSTINVTDGSDSMKGRNGAENGTVTINGSTDGVAVMVAIIEYPGSTNYHAFASIDAAIAYAKAGETIKLLSNVTVANKIVINKSIALDGNGKTLTYTGTDRVIDVPNDANANLDVTIKNLNVVATTANRGLNYNENGKFNVEGVTVTIGENVDGYAINFPGMADGAQVTIKDSKLTSRNPLNIWGENMTINVHNSEIISVDNSTTYDYAAIQLNNEIPTAGPNGAIANGTVVNVYGGTITALNDNGQPSNVVANATETGVVNISDETVITGKVLNYVANIGGAYFGSLQAAVNAIEKHGYNSPIVIMKDFAAEATTIKSGLKVTINLNGKTITATDNETKSYGLININQGAELTINDATGNGAIKLTATNNREWNAYSSVISNQRGKLTVNGGTIEHLGGTDMAYAIDNLTNGKGTKAETVINGGTIKSTYRAVRQFLNGTEAQNILTVNGGTIEGTNKSIWMQDPSKNANSGTLTVGEGATLNGDVYLFVTAGSTEWPVTVAVAAAALKGESKVVTGNVPAGYDVAEVNGTYGIYTGVAKIGTAYYETLKAAVEAAQAGDTITLIDNVEATEVILLGKSLTINGNGYKVTSNATRVFRATTSNTEITLNDVNMVNTAVRVGTNDIRGISVDDVQNVKLTLDSCSVDFTDASANDWAYAVNVTGGNNHVVTVNGGAYEGANVINVRGANQTVTVKDAVLTSLYPNNDQYFGACIYVVQNENSSVVATGNTFNGDNAKAFNIGYTPVEESDNIDNTKYVVAMIGDAYYTSIQAAVEAAQNGETIKLTQNVKMDTKTLATQNDGYAVLVNVNGKKVAIDLNGKKITVNAAAAELAGAKGGMLLGVFSADLGGHLTLTDNSDAKNGAVTLNVNDAKVYGMFVSESGQSDKSNSGKITVDGGNYTTVGKVSNAMFFADANEVITVNGGNFHCDQVSNTANYPWMFNTLGNNELHVIVNGGTFNVDINHQHRPFEVKVPETLAVKANGDGTWTVVPAEAYITEMLGATVNEAGEWGHKVGYATIAEAIAAVNELGNKVSIAKDLELTETVVVPADKTMVLDLNGKTVIQKKACTASYEMIKNLGNLTITDDTEAKAGKLSFKDTSVGDPNFGWGSYTVRNEGTLVIENGTIEHLGTQSFGTHCIMAVFQYSGSTTINGGTISTPNYRSARLWKGDMTINGGTFDGQVWVQAVDNTAKLTINGGTFEPNGNDASSVFVTNNQYDVQFAVTNGTFNGKVGCSDATKLTEAISGGTFSETAKNGTNAELLKDGFIWSNVNADGTYNVVVDPAFGNVAKIGNGSVFENQYFATINDAVQAAQNGETVTLIADVETSAANLATITDNYAVIVAVKEKQVTLDLNGKSVTVNPTAEELANAKDKMLMSVFGIDTNGNLTLKGEGSVKVNANGANVYSLAAAYGEGAQLFIENGNYEADAVMSSGSLIYAQQANCITVSGGKFDLGNLGTGANDSPWIFNTVGKNNTGIKVVGGTFPTDINHQFWANEVFVPEHLALQENADGTWTVVEAVAYTHEIAASTGSKARNVGYASIEDAIAATAKYRCDGNIITMQKDITLEPITIANGVKVALYLDGKTISGTDNSTASFGLITNKGDLTIEGPGTIQLTATNDRGWGAYSSVISNQVGGKLTVNGGTIQHLGGTSMAYAIDNLTNGKDTYAETIINGGEIKSTYRPIRMFLNGVEADNILTVNAGTIESTGGNKAAIWMQTAGDVAHSGTLYVGEKAVIKNNVYLDADNLKNVREYPVEAYIAKDALADGMTVIADAIPAETAALVEYDTFWQVEQKNLAELTIEDACEEYINKIEKNVGVLTYKRYFDDTEWQTIVLPFDVPVANLTEQFEVAYIYNASYKGKQATIDYVVIDENSAIETLRANYPYMIRAKAEGWHNIVVENAKLMPTTEVETLDCSSVFEKFSFIGSYATVETETLDATKGYFNLISGAWSQLGTVNPFRFYMQIEKRDGSAFEYPGTEAKAIRMRQVNANGEATGIDSVGAVTEQNSGLIFDLHGRRVVEPKKGGLYIVNGKKVVF